MLPFSIVKGLDKYKGISFDLGVRSVRSAMHPLVLEAIEPTARRRVITAVSFTAHRSGHAIRLELVLKGMAGALVPPVGMVHQVRCRAFREPGHADARSDRSGLSYLAHSTQVTSRVDGRDAWASPAWRNTCTGHRFAVARQRLGTRYGIEFASNRQSAPTVRAGIPHQTRTYPIANSATTSPQTLAPQGFQKSVLNPRSQEVSRKTPLRTPFRGVLCLWSKCEVRN